MSTTKTAVERRAPKKFGTREEVFAGTAQQTKGGLTKDDLFESNNRGKIVTKSLLKAGVYNDFVTRAQNVTSWL